MKLRQFKKKWFKDAAPKNAVKANEILTFTGIAADTNTVTIGANIYEFDNDDTITEGNIKVDMSGFLIKSVGVLTFTGAVIEKETVVIGDDTFEFIDDGTAEVGSIEVLVTGDLTSDNAIEKLVEAINENSEAVTAVGDTEANTVTLTAVEGGTDGNAIGTTETLTNGSFGAVTLANGADEVIKEDAVVILSESINVNSEVVTAVSDVEDYTVTITAIEGGTDGNAITTTETLSNGSFANATLTEGANEVVKENAVIILEDAINTNENEIVTALQGDDTLLVSAKLVGDEGNDIAIDEDCTNATWEDGADKLSGGQYATPIRVSGYIVLGGVLYIAENPVTKWSQAGWKSASPSIV